MKPISRRRLDLNFKILKGLQPRSILLYYASLFHYVSLLIYILPALSISSCTEKEESVRQIGDSAVIYTTIEKLSPKPVKTLDILVYESQNTRRLLMHRRLNPNNGYAKLADTLSGTAPGEAFIVAAIANLPLELNISALGNFESLELARMDFASDIPEIPVMSAWGTTDNSGNITLKLSPLMCAITVRAISNALGASASNPGIWLENVNSSVEILRKTGFRPTEVIDSCSFSFLPSDIGRYAQYPKTVVYCYPNDYSDGIGTPGTRLGLQFELNGCRIMSRSTIPPFSRSESAYVDIQIQEDSLCHFEWTVHRTE